MENNEIEKTWGQTILINIAERVSLRTGKWVNWSDDLEPHLHETELRSYLKARQMAGLVTQC